MLFRNAVILSSLLLALFLVAGFPTNSKTSGFSEPFSGSRGLPRDGRQPPARTDSKRAVSRDVPGTALQSSPDGFSLKVVRQNHTATALADGRVVIIGGENNDGAVRESEILDPSSQVISVAARSLVPRTQHTATLLPDGRVLVTGGENQDGLLSSTEFFDPATASFSPGPRLKRARAGHTATLLENGQVLITGGRADATVELFDPATNRSLLLKAKLAVPRIGHSAIVLADGNVFLAGGEQTEGHNMDTAEVFNTRTSRFSPAANPMTIPRAHPTLRVLPDGKVQVIGGDLDGSMEVYDPASGRFGAAAHLVPTADLFPLPEMLSAQTRAGFIESENYRELNAKRPASRLKDAVADLKDYAGRSQYAVAEVSGLNQAVLVGGVDDDANFVRSVALLKSSSAAISSDKVEYLPGDTPVISGAGWKPFERVTIVRQEARLSHKRTTLHAVADQLGNFVCRDLKASDYQVWVTYTLTARGEWSEQVAQTTYSDVSPPGQELATFPKTGRIKIPMSSRDISVETDTVLVKSRVRSPIPARFGRVSRASLSPASLTCSVPNSTFNIKPDFSSIINQPCFGAPGNPCSAIGDVRLTDACMAVSGSFVFDFCLAPFCGGPAVIVKESVEENFQGAAAFDINLTSGGTLTLFDIPIPDASIELGLPGDLSKLFSVVAGFTIRAKINATVNSPFEVKPQFDLSEGFAVGFDTTRKPAFFKDVTAPPTASGNLQLVKLGNGDVKVEIGPHLGVTLDAFATANLDFGLGLFPFIDAGITNAMPTATCPSGLIDLTAGMAGDADAQFILTPPFVSPITIVDAHPSFDFFNDELPGFPKPFILDTTPPVITCPANIAAAIPPNQKCAVVNYAPVATDNCGALSVVCVPPSGSCFPPGVTTVKCTATDTSGNQSSCGFTVTAFDVCLQDDHTGDSLKWNSTTGDYLFTRCGTGGFTMAGKGTLGLVNGVRLLTDRKPDRTIAAFYLTNQLTGHAGVSRIYGPGTLQSFAIFQTNPHPTCVCPP